MQKAAERPFFRFFFFRFWSQKGVLWSDFLTLYKSLLAIANRKLKLKPWRGVCAWGNMFYRPNINGPSRAYFWPCSASRVRVFYMRVHEKRQTKNPGPMGGRGASLVLGLITYQVNWRIKNICASSK